MYVEKVTRIEMSKEELEILKQAESILADVCNVFDTSCEDCPLYNICSSKITPASILYRCINALPKESEKK